ncbi:MAG: NnrS family protein, partial [Exilibacterium sp.]
FKPYSGHYFWHAHEMLFGFVVAIMAGFLLTAVQTWTKVPSVKGKPLIMLVAVWLLARLSMAFPGWISGTLIVITDLLFLPLAALYLSIPIVKARLWRNLFFVPILLLMAVLNGLMHGTAQGAVQASFFQIAHIMILMVTLVMCIMGGRVFPMFTANGTKTERVEAIAWLERLSIISVGLSVLIASEVVALPDEIAAAIFFTAGAANFLRALRWKIWVTFKTPLVWSLHVSYWAICLGLILLGAAKLQLFESISFAYHTITVGGIGIMILSMISRVSLGHTGRFIQVGPVMTAALIAIVVAFIVRVFAPILFVQYDVVILASAALWIIAYGSFVVVYAPVLFKPRMDGGAG